MHRKMIPITFQQSVRWFGCVITVALLGTGLMAWQRSGSADGAAQAQGKPASAAAKRPAAAKTATDKPLNFDIAPETNVDDPYPTFNGITVDPENNIVAMSDLNRHGLLIYDRMAHSTGGE